MINKLAVAMIVGAMTVLPAAAASAQQATGSNGVTSNNAGQKPTNKEGLPTNCMAGDTACNSDPNAASNMNGAANVSGSADMKGTTDMGTTGSTNANNNAQGVLDTSGNSPKCRDNDTTCANTDGRPTK